MATSRAGVALVLGSSLALILGGTAWGEPTLENDRARANSVVELTLRVMTEQNADEHQRVSVELPPGMTGEVCTAEAGWSCAVLPAEGGGGYRLLWERVPDQPGTGGDVHRFHFRVRTPAQDGDYPMPVEQVSVAGQTHRWDGPQDSPNPAPVLRVGTPSRFWDY